MLLPLVSVILPFYNAENDLFYSVESVKTQTYKNWELILINNVSTDQSLQIAEGLLKTDSRIKLITEPSPGIAFALNKGLQSASGKYVARMDADDLCKPERLERQVQILESNPEIGLVSTQTEYLSSIPDSKGFEIFVNWQNSILNAADHYTKRFIESPLAHPTVMYRKSLIENFGSYSTDNIPEDYELWLRWMEKGVRFFKIPEKLLVWKDSEFRLSRKNSCYSEEAFLKVKVKYLSYWLKRKAIGKKIIVCGTGKISFKGADLLEKCNVPVFAFTDVVNRNLVNKNFLLHTRLPFAGDYIIINFIRKRGVGDRIAEFLSLKGYAEGVDFIRAG